MSKKAPLPVDIHVGSRIRSRRMQLGRGQEWLGNKLGLSFQQVQKYEKGSNRVGGSRLVQIAEALEVAPAFFFEGAPGQPNAPSMDFDAGLRAFTTSRAGLAIITAWPKLAPGVRDALASLVTVATAEAVS